MCLPELNLIRNLIRCMMCKCENYAKIMLFFF